MAKYWFTIFYRGEDGWEYNTIFHGTEEGCRECVKQMEECGFSVTDVYNDTFVTENYNDLMVEDAHECNVYYLMDMVEVA